MKRFSLFAVGILGLGFATAQVTVSHAQNAGSDATTNVEAAEITRTNVRRDQGEGRTRSNRIRGVNGEIFRQIFDAADANADGAVSPDEVDAYRAARIGEVDTSGDGALSIEEFDTLYRSFTRSRMVDAFQVIDADGDGQIADDEMDRSISRLVTRLDRDGDGTLTLRRQGQSTLEE